MSSHAPVHAVKRRLQLSPNEQDVETAKKPKSETVFSEPLEPTCPENDAYIDESCNSCVLKGKDNEDVWNEDHYKVEIIANLMTRETARFPLGCRSSYTPHRHRIIEWMCQAKTALRVCDEVLQLAVYFFDRFVDGATSLFLGNRLELYVLSCIQLAAKTLEWDNQIPRNSDLNRLLVRPFELSDYTEVERRLLLFFQWNVTLPVVNTFLGLFRSYLVENSCDVGTKNSLLRYADYFEAISLRREQIPAPIELYYRKFNKYVSFQKLAPSLISSAIVFTCRALVRVEPSWPNTLASVVHYKDLDLLPNVGLLTKLLNNDNGEEAMKLKNDHLIRNPLTYLESGKHWKVATPMETRLA